MILSCLIYVIAASIINYEQYSKIFSNISMMLYVLAIVFLVLAIVSFIVFKIPRAISNLNGKTAKKSVEQMRIVNSSKDITTSGIDNAIKDNAINKSNVTVVTNNVRNFKSNDQDETVKLDCGLNDDIQVTQYHGKSVGVEMIQNIVITHTQEVI